VVESSASESIGFSAPSTADSGAANVPSSNDENYDKLLRQSLTLTWKIPGEYRVCENVSKVYKSHKRYNRGINSVSDDSDYKSTQTNKHQENKGLRLKSIASSKSGTNNRRQKYHLSLHETRSIKEVDRVRTSLNKFSGNTNCPYNCDCFDCYTINMPEESSEDSSCKEEIDSVAIIGGVNYSRRIDRFRATEERRNRRLARACAAEQGDTIGVEDETENQFKSRCSERFQYIESMPDFVYEFEIFLDNIKKESILFDGIIKVYRGLLLLCRCLLMKITVSRNTRVNPHPIYDQFSNEFVIVDIDPPSKERRT